MFFLFRIFFCDLLSTYFLGLCISSNTSNLQPESALLLSQLQYFGLKVIAALLGSMPSLVAQDALTAIIANPSNVLQLLQIARMPIPLHEAPEIRSLETKCTHLAQLIHDQQRIDLEVSRCILQSFS